MNNTTTAKGLESVAPRPHDTPASATKIVIPEARYKATLFPADDKTSLFAIYTQNKPRWQFRLLCWITGGCVRKLK